MDGFLVLIYGIPPYGLSNPKIDLVDSRGDTNRELSSILFLGENFLWYYVMQNASSFFLNSSFSC